MTVKELKELLEKCNEDEIVVMSKDAEGNGHSPLYGVYSGLFYDADSTYSGTVLREDEVEEFAWKPDKVVKCVLLSPTN